jgi:hypothetical protein
VVAHLEWPLIAVLPQFPDSLFFQWPDESTWTTNVDCGPYARHRPLEFVHRPHTRRLNAAR